MVKSSWLYSLRKEELSEICGAFDLDTKPTVEDMRKAVAALIATPDLAADMKVKLTELETRNAAKTLHLPEGTGRGVSPKRYVQEKYRAARPWSEFVTASKDLTELIALEERLEDIPAPTVASLPRETSGPFRVPSDVSFNLELLVVGRSVDHLTLGMDLLAKAGTITTMANTTVNITNHNEAQGPMSTHGSER
uniref:Uncharacterized protein n=1 Tax=Glossina pallidipes TaxID=7398 RepID=A0A1A9ZXF7_GLOPL